MSEQTELLPCPFCGADAVRHPRMSYHITCNNNECPMQGTYMMDRTWNTRAPLTPDNEVGRLRELVVHCWIYSGYRNCGYTKMTAAQKELFDAVTTVTIHSLKCL